MDINLFSSDTEMHCLIDSIIYKPSQWEGWSCIHIRSNELKVFNVAKELLYELEKKLFLYLRNIDGKLFYIKDEDIYVFCNNICQEEVKILSNNLLDILFGNSQENATINLYHFPKCADKFEYDIVKTCKLFSPLSAVVHCLDKIKDFNEKPEPVKVLIVEDDATTRWMYRKILKDHCIIETSEDIKSSIKKIENSKPDIVFLDINLPDGSGFVLLDWIISSVSYTKVVICSGNKDIESKSRAIKRGASSYLGKPLIKEEIIEQLNLYH
jgi:CheY-like chemotaxis protein